MVLSTPRILCPWDFLKARTFKTLRAKNINERFKTLCLNNTNNRTIQEVLDWLHNSLYLNFQLYFSVLVGVSDKALNRIHLFLHHSMFWSPKYTSRELEIPLSIYVFSIPGNLMRDATCVSVWYQGLVIVIHHAFAVVDKKAKCLCKHM